MAAFFVLWHLGLLPFTLMLTSVGISCLIVQVLLYQMAAFEFIYLGTLISNDNSVEKEIQRRILAGTGTYFAAVSLFRSRLLSRATKIIL